ncbi:Type IV pilus biogenesis protein PilQ, partial [hydrothermal vent metagenome]
NLGVQWGGALNTVTGANFPNTIGVTGAAGASPNVITGGSVVDFSVPSSAALGLTLGHVNGTALLDMKLMAMEQNGQGRIVSMPKITTMNNKEASIESGQEIPYQTTSSEGTKTEFKKAVLSLKVKPHITPDNHIRMEIDVNKDSPGQTTPDGIAIDTKHALTEVIVGNGSTAVIGGLFKNDIREDKDQVPGIGNFPILGWLFKNKINKRTGEELLIFITPKIVE